MSTTTVPISQQLAAQSYLDPGMISASLEYWFSDNKHIRSPFPEPIRKQLAEDATIAMLKWAAPLSAAAKKELNEEMLAERFEEILFEIALALVTDEDQKITIQYPFMPRVGDDIDQKDNAGSSGATGKITSRKIDKRGDHTFLVIEHQENGTGKTLTTEFEIP